MLEIKPPKEILKPFKAMEDVYAILWGLYDGANWRERWCEGELPKYPYWMSWEIVSIEGQIHFYLRIQQQWRNVVESAIYGHFPEIEISVVEDYTKKVPQDIPNKDWDLYGEDYRFVREDPYPIKTYSQFWEEKPDVPKEEKRIDPLDSLLEEMSRLDPGQQFWFQMITAPILDSDIPWITEGEDVANKIARRPKRSKPESLVGAVAGELAKLGGGAETEEEKKAKERALPRGVSEEEEAKELLISPKERQLLTAVQTKISKRGFLVWMRIIYLYKRDAYVSRHKIIRSYLNQFATEDMNAIRFWGLTRTRIHYWFRQRRLQVRKTKIFDKYVRRLPTLFPRLENKAHFRFKWRKAKGSMVLNTEELATLYHFPARVSTGVVAALKPIEAKKGGPPPELPVE